MTDFAAISPSATPVLSMDFSLRLGVKTVASATWVVLDDTDTPVPSALLGAIDISGMPVIRQQVGNLVNGKKYLHRCIVVTNQAPYEHIVGELWQKCLEGA